MIDKKNVRLKDETGRKSLKKKKKVKWIICTLFKNWRIILFFRKANLIENKIYY